MSPAWQIARTAFVTAAITASGTAGWLVRTSGRKSPVLGDLVGMGIASGLGVLFWCLGPTCLPSMTTCSLVSARPMC